MTEIIVPIAPIPKARPRMRKGPGARVFTPRSTELSEARIREAWLAQVGGTPSDGPIALWITVAIARPRSHYGTGRNAAILKPSAPNWPSGRPDWDNYAKMVSDALNGVAYRDDGQIVIAHVSKCYVEGAAHWVIDVERVRSAANGGGTMNMQCTPCPPSFSGSRRRPPR